MAPAPPAEPVYRHRAERWESGCEITIDDGCGRELSARIGNVSNGAAGLFEIF